LLVHNALQQKQARCKKHLKNPKQTTNNKLNATQQICCGDTPVPACRRSAGSRPRAARANLRCAFYGRSGATQGRGGLRCSAAQPKKKERDRSKRSRPSDFRE